MTRTIFHLLLVFALVFNGISAPCAMPGMDQGDHIHAASMDAASDTAAPMDHSRHHASMQHDSTQQDATHAGQAGDDSAMHDCCNGPGCNCGCILSSAVLAALMPAMPQIMQAAPGVSSPVPDGSRHSLPPFRPPAA